jgi:hypothetical protein
MINSDSTNDQTKTKPIIVIYDRHKTLLPIDFKAESDLPYVGCMDH